MTEPAKPSPSEKVKTFVADLSRPFAMYSVSGATAYAIATGSTAEKVGAAGLILAALYGARTIENQQQSKDAAKVEIAKVNAAPQVAPAEPIDTGELPESERIK